MTPDFSNIRIVLVNTSHPGNIGAAARAMKNMGLSNLTLVAPRDFPSGVATGRASSAKDILENAMVVETLAEAVADCGVVIGTSARSRGIPIKLMDPEECAQRVIDSASSNKVAVVFGREISGLSNDELNLCHLHVQIPVNEEYSSLNVAAAVMVLCYEIRKFGLAKMDSASDNNDSELDEDKTEQWDQELATSADVEYFMTHLEEVLIKLDFHDPDNPRQLMRRLRRLYNRVQLDKMEINILRGILTSTEEKMEK